MNALLSDEEVTGLLAEAAATFEVPLHALDVPAGTHRPAWRRPRPLIGAAAALAVATALLLQGGPGGGASVDAARAMKSPASAGGLGPVAAPGGGQPVPTVLDRTTGGATSAPGTGQGAAGARGGRANDQARVVKTGTISVVVDKGKVSATVARLQSLVVGLRGYVADSATEEAGDHPTASLTVRVPVSAFEQLIGQVRALPVEVVSAQTTGADVTATYADTAAQIRSLQAARSRYLDILSGAKTIGEVLMVQQRVDDVQAQIDRLTTQQRVLADQSELGTLTLTVSDTADQVLATPARGGWGKAWHDATHGFTSGLQSLVAGSGRALLVLLVGSVLLLLGRTGWRLARRRLL